MSDAVPCVVHIRRIADGVVRQWNCDWWDNDYVWAEGNFSCDCNRHLFFYRAIGQEPEEDVACAETLYAIDKIELADGSVVYSETDEGGERARDAHLYSEGRKEEMKKPEDWP